MGQIPGCLFRFDVKNPLTTQRLTKTKFDKNNKNAFHIENLEVWTGRKVMGSNRIIFMSDVFCHLLLPYSVQLQHSENSDTSSA